MGQQHLKQITRYSFLMINLLQDYPVVIDVSVAWGDMDALQHINNVIYFRYFESARVAYFEQIDLFRVMDETGIGAILASTQCHYKIPLRYPDNISVGAKVSDIGHDRFYMEYCIASQDQRKIAAQGDCVMVSFDYRNNKKVPVPDVLRQRIAFLEKDQR